MARLKKSQNSSIKASSQKATLSRNRIYEACLQILASKGFEELNVREISKRSGLSLGLVHRYIGNRHKMMKVLAEYVATKAYTFLESPSETSNGVEKVRFNFNQNLRFFLAHPHYGKFFLLMYFYASVDPKVRSFNHQLVLAAEQRLKGYVKEWRPQLKEAQLDILSRTLQSLLLGTLVKIASTMEASKTDQEIFEAFNVQLDATLSSLSHHNP